MNAKELKFLELFDAFVRIDIAADKMALTKSIRQFMDLDYQMAVNVWEYLAATKEDKLGKDEKLAEIIGFELFNQFYARAAVKCVKAICDVATVRRAVYQYSKNAGAENALAILVDLLVANKVNSGEEILKCLLKNERIQYGQVLKRMLERVFIELLKKNPAKIEMNRKLAEMLLTYIRKIKTDERAMLEQRIKEIR